jgi:hypothetical protein
MFENALPALSLDGGCVKLTLRRTIEMFSKSKGIPGHGGM